MSPRGPVSTGNVTPPISSVLIVILAMVTLAGCVTSSDPEAPTIMVGDHLTYRYENSRGQRGFLQIRVEAIETARFPDGAWCEGAIYISHWEDAKKTGDEPGNNVGSAGSPRDIEILCPPAAARIVRVSSRAGHLNETEIMIQGHHPTDKGLVIVCAQLAADPTIDNLPLSGSFGHGRTMFSNISRTRDGTCRQTTNSIDLVFGVRMWSNSTTEFHDGPYPTSIRRETIEHNVGEEGSTYSQSWTLTEREEGTGEAWRNGPHGQVEPPRLTAWSDRPAEGISPFRYPMESALTILGLDRAFQTYKQAHPEAFLAAAAYSTHIDQIERQEEYLWLFYWIDGIDAFFVKCHLLRSPVGGAPILPTYEESECWDTKTATSQFAHSRTMHGADALSWEDAAGLWRKYMGADAPIGTAAWSTVDTVSLPFLNSLQPLTEGGPTPPTIHFNYHPGSLDTVPFSPTWKLGKPAAQSRASPIAPSYIEAESGAMFVITTPAMPDWLRSRSHET